VSDRDQPSGTLACGTYVARSTTGQTVPAAPLLHRRGSDANPFFPLPTHVPGMIGTCVGRVCQDALMRLSRPTLDGMTATREDGQQPIVPLPEREPAALRAAVAKLDTAALAKFESDWTAATTQARDEYSLMPARYFVEHWWNWVAVERWPVLAARLRDCERIVAESPDRNARRAAAAEISEILRRAESATT
jgi:hypothetical protein